MGRCASAQAMRIARRLVAVRRARLLSPFRTVRNAARRYRGMAASILFSIDLLVDDA